jgi:acetyl esterase/lipase
VFTVPKNYLMSPYLASDELLRQFPKTNILSTIVDPTIDDCVEFAKKLKGLQVDSQLDILGGLNHGFLNFAGVCSKLLKLIKFLMFVFFNFSAIKRLSRCLNALHAKTRNIVGAGS